jgi:hypothetical protein
MMWESLAMDRHKCRALKAELGQQVEPQSVPIARFFDGNDDLGSIGCNLEPHPGIPAFKSTLEGLLGRPGIEGVWAQIAELDPGDDSWPFADLVVVAGAISASDLRKLVKKLKPDDVAEATDYTISPAIAKMSSPLWVLWWD